MQLKSLEKHYCPFCDKWFKNQSLDDKEEFYVHTPGIYHPENALNFISKKPWWN